MVEQSKPSPSGEVEKVIRLGIAELLQGYFDHETPQELLADMVALFVSHRTTYAEDNERLRLLTTGEPQDAFVAMFKDLNDRLTTAQAEIERLRATVETLQFGERMHNERAEAAQAEIEKLRAERDLLRAETDAKAQTISAMQDRVDWAYKQKEAAEAGHRMQTKATLAFREDWLAAQAEIERLRAERDGAEPIGYLKPWFEGAVEPFFIYAKDRTEEWSKSVFTIPVYAVPPQAEEMRKALEEADAACDGHALDVGFVHGEPTRKDLQQRLDTVRSIARTALMKGGE